MCSGMTLVVHKMWIAFVLISLYSLAMAMMYICTAALVLNLDLRLYETTAWDNEMAVDAEKHSPLKKSKGLRVTVRESGRLSQRRNEDHFEGDAASQAT